MAGGALPLAFLWQRSLILPTFNKAKTYPTA